MVIESYKMNSSPQGDIDPYYECTYAGTMTPTVVSNFHLPNSNVNKDGPYLKILEQPQTKFRFRYKSEMVGTHGQLKAESSDKNKNVFPTVQLKNWNGGPALVRLTLFTAEDNANDRKRHVHELNGKNCNKDGFAGGCEVVVDEDNNYTAQFPNLGIIHIAKRDVQNIIFQKKKEELINFSCMNNPGLRTESIQHNITPTKLQKLKEEAEEEARNMDLNKVALRFQAFFYDTKTNCYRPITEYVDSDVIFNLKNASTGELKIVRISAVSSPCTGGAEVWMLVEKVKKNNVRIKFYELDQDNQEVWKSYGEFKESDVHHQYAIVFRTPAYRYTNIREPVYVKVQLERTTDNDTSEPLDFTFVPENLKRSNAYLESKIEYEVNPQKRARTNEQPLEAMNLKTRGPLFLGSRDIKQPYSPEAAYQSPPHMVPSPITPADSPSSQGLYSPPHQGISHNPSINITGDDMVYLTCNGEDSVGMSLEHSIDQNQISNLMNMNTQYQYMSESHHDTFYNPNSNYQMLSPYHQAPSPASNGQGSPLGGQMSPFSQGAVSPGHSISPSFQSMIPNEADNAFVQIQQFDAVQKQVIHSKNVSSPDQWDFSGLTKSPVEQDNAHEDIDLLDIMNNLSESKIFGIPKDVGDIQADFAHTPVSKSSDNVNNESKDIDSITDQLSQVSFNNKVKEEKKAESQTEDNFLKAALTASECLQSYAVTGDVSLLLATHRYLFALQNDLGENCLHAAILNGNKDVFCKLLKAASCLLCSDLVTAQNIYGETPLHLAVRLNQLEMVNYLLVTPGCNTNAVEGDGNSALHLAAMKPNHLTLAAILSHPVNGEDATASKIINLYNFQGQTPLHLAVISGCLESVKLLLKNCAQIHMCEQKQGANPLHLCAIHGRHDIAKYLIENTSITVDAGMLDGNTALHIAAESKDKKMCALLMAGKANSRARNSLQKSTTLPEEEPEDEKEGSCSEDGEEEGLTPIDYAEGDEEILSILSGSQELLQKEDGSESSLEEESQESQPISETSSNQADASAFEEPYVSVSAQI